jgi:hypothetical protein
MEYTIRNTKSRLWLMEYPIGHNLHRLKYTWTLEWTKANRYLSEEAAIARARELGVEHFIPESVRLLTNPT